MRLIQVLGSFIPGAMNGWLLYYITAKNLGPSQLMLVLELLVCSAHSLAARRQSRDELSIIRPFRPQLHIVWSNCVARLPPHSYTRRFHC